MKRATQDIYPIEPLTEKGIEACDEISKAINRWFEEYMKPGPNGISEADRTYLAHLYTPQGQIFAKMMKQLDKEA